MDVISPAVQSYNSSRVTISTIRFDGTAGNGAVGSVLVASIDADVLVRAVVPVCYEDLVSAGAGQVSLGTPAAHASLIAATVGTTLDRGEIWQGAAVAVLESTPLVAACKDIIFTYDIVGVNLNFINLYVTVGDITDGILMFYILWDPLMPTASVDGVGTPAWDP